MIVVEKAKLRFLLAGLPVPLEVSREYRKGRLYSFGMVGRRLSLGRVMVQEIVELEPGAWRITVLHAAEERPRLLAARLGGAGGDYTDRPDRAAQGEPEALSDADLERYASTARWKADQERRELAHRARIQARRSRSG